MRFASRRRILRVLAIWVLVSHIGGMVPLAFAGPPSRAVRRLVSDGYRHLVRPEAESTVQQPFWRARYNLRRHDRWRTWFDEVRSMFLFPLVEKNAGFPVRWPGLFLLARPWLWAVRRLRRRSRPRPIGRAPD